MGTERRLGRIAKRWVYGSGTGPYGNWPPPVGGHLGAGSVTVRMQYGLVASQPFSCQLTTGASTLNVCPPMMSFPLGRIESTPYCARNLSSVEPIRTLMPWSSTTSVMRTPLANVPLVELRS